LKPALSPLTEHAYKQSILFIVLSALGFALFWAMRFYAQWINVDILYALYLTPDTAAHYWAQQITWLGSAHVFLVGAAVLFFISLWHKNYKLCVFMVLFSFMALGSVGFFKWFIHSARPSLAGEDMLFNSFPSGHTARTVVLLLMLWEVLKRYTPKLAKQPITYIFLVLIALVVGYSRLALAAHWMTDVMAAYCLMLFWYIGLQKIRLTAPQ